MADFDNLSGINDNFDTIKTLLNSIRAQGILNTSDVDKLLTGINSKLERLNTEEDIDLIKLFLSELKQNLEERHNVLVSKFGAIESLFSNLLKNSSEMPKSNELKELFDIVATNLSVFSREVVSQKESLTDITLRLDALRSDDSQKKDIIKNIGLLKPDLERLNNGFDSIVLSLNENFKTIIKTITSFDKTEYFDRFSDVLTGMEMSSNTILSAVQMLDKKTEQVENALKNLATQSDISSADDKLSNLTSQSQALTESINNLSSRYLVIDDLAEKIDASVNIIAGLKSVLEDSDNQNTKIILEKLGMLESELQTISTDEKFEEFRVSLEQNLKSLQDGTSGFDSLLTRKGEEVARVINNEISKLTTLQDANVTRVLNDISTSADALNSKLAQAQTSIAALCDKNFSSVFENISNVKTLIAQIDENSVSANNAIFSNITDRLTLFENSLKTSLDNQEKTVAESTSKLVEQVENIKNLSGVLDYKMDSTVVEAGNVKRELSSLKDAVDAVLALDFVNTVKDLRVDLYASKQELMNTVESVNTELSDKITNDLYGKYELLISKLDTVEDEIKKTQSDSLNGLRGILEKISSSIVDIISYVSEQKAGPEIDYSSKFDEIASSINDTNLSYVESVREIVEAAKASVLSNLESLEEYNAGKFEDVKKSISESSEDLKNELKYSYAKLLEIQDSYKEIREILDFNKIDASNKYDGIISSAQDAKSEFESQIIGLKGVLLEKISEFKQDFTCSNADKVSELKFAVENLYSKNSQEVTDILTELKVLFEKFTTDDSSSRAAILAKLLDNFVSLKSQMSALNDKTADDVKNQVDVILQDFANVKTILEKVDENVDGDMTRQLSIIESNFESLVSQITILFDKSEQSVSNRINDEFSKISLQMQDSLSEKLEAYKLKIEETFDKLSGKTIEQSDYLQNRISELNSSMKSFWEEQNDSNSKQIDEMAETLKNILDENIKLTAVDYISFKEKLSEFAKNIQNNNKVLTEDLKSELDDITKYIDSVLDIQAQEIQARHSELLTKDSEIIELQKSSSADTIEKITESTAKNLEKLESVETHTVNELNKSREIAKEQFESLIAAQNNIINRINSSDSVNEEHFETLQVTHNDITNSINEQIEELKNVQNAVIGSIDAATALNEEHFETLQVTHNDISTGIANLESNLEKRFNIQQNNYNILTDNIKEIASDTESQIKALAQNINITSTKQMEFAQASSDAQSQSLKDIKSVTDEQLNFSRLAQTDTLQAIDEVKKVGQEQVSVSEKLNTNLDSLTQICITNNALATRAEDASTERHDEVLMKADSIINTVENTSSSTKNDIAGLTKLVNANKDLLGHLDQSLNKSVTALNTLTAEISAGELQTLDSYVTNILEQIEEEKANVKNCKDLIVEFTKKELDLISQNIEKETDIIIGELVEQFDLLRDSQNDDINDLTSRIEEIVTSQVYNNIEDLKSYLDIKTDNTVLSEKLDNLKSDLMDSVENILVGINNTLDLVSFDTEINVFKENLESLVTNEINNLNKELRQFVAENFAENTASLENKLTLLDKKFIDTVVDKYAEIQLISNSTKESYETVKESLTEILSQFNEAKTNTHNKIEALTQEIENANITAIQEFRMLNESFEGLRSQISNKSFDEAFQASINKQIKSLEDLITEQMSYVDDISELCEINLPEVSELNAIVKHSVLGSLEKLSEKLDSKTTEETVSRELQELKADIITQFLNVFNQISFVTEQEEILDFIHEKHEELITILSHIVTSAADIEDIKENVSLVDNKIDNLKEDIDLINEKITAIMSSDGDVDYVYSLQDLESDIASLRVELNALKDNNHSEELQELIKSTNDIYTLVDSIQTELPKQKDFDSIAEDIVSISTRTNKLILASDESYKTLQDNLQDFKLVINDLDERTKNFAQDSGMEKVNAKLNAINSMMEKGAKTNQVFNQVFEYLAEWVDNAGVQINTITDKVETLGEISQIKAMLADLKAGAEDNSDTVELIEALGAVFEKQTKRISSLEAKLDKIIVETTINNRNNKLDLTPMEDTLNRFLVVMDEKMSLQQAKITSLEEKLAGALELLDKQETSQLTKKVGGMDRQIAKLNKSIEKIASHVIEE